MTIRAGRGDYRHYKPQYVEAGAGISIDKTDPVRPIISNKGVLSVGAGAGVSVDSTDPLSPIITNEGVLSTQGGEGISVDSTDPKSPIITNDGVLTVSKEPSARNTVVISGTGSAVEVGHGNETYIDTSTSADWASTPSVWTAPPYTVKRYDVNNELSGSVFSPKRAGNYIFTVQLYQKASTDTSNNVQTRLFHYNPAGDLSRSLILDLITGTKITRIYSACGLLRMSVGDTAQINVYSSSYSQGFYGGISNYCTMQIARVLT